MRAQSRTGRSFFKDTEGVEGFFSEIPALVVVIVGLTAFMINAIGAYSLHAGALGSEESLDNAASIAEAFSSYDPVLHNGKRSRFWAASLDLVTADDIERDLNMPIRYRIVITEYIGLRDGDRVPGRSWLFGEALGKGSPAASVTRTVLVGSGVESSPIYHMSEMLVMVW